MVKIEFRRGYGSGAATRLQRTCVTDSYAEKYTNQLVRQYVTCVTEGCGARQEFELASSPSARACDVSPGLERKGPQRIAGVFEIGRRFTAGPRMAMNQGTTRQQRSLLAWLSLPVFRVGRHRSAATHSSPRLHSPKIAESPGSAAVAAAGDRLRLISKTAGSHRSAGRHSAKMFWL